MAKRITDNGQKRGVATRHQRAQLRELLLSGGGPRPFVMPCGFALIEHSEFAPQSVTFVRLYTPLVSLGCFQLSVPRDGWQSDEGYRGSGTWSPQRKWRPPSPFITATAVASLWMSMPMYLMFMVGAPLGRVLYGTQNLPQRGVPFITRAARHQANDSIRRRLGAAQKSPSVHARFADNRENCGKAVGSRPCATSMPALHPEPPNPPASVAAPR